MKCLAASDASSACDDPPTHRSIVSRIVFIVWAAKEIVDLIAEVIQFKENLKTAFVINRKIANTAIGRDVGEALAGYPMPVLRSSICQRVAFAESAAQGLTVMDIEPNGSAAKEIEALVNELLEL